MFHDGLTADSVATLRIEAERAGMDMLVQLNRLAMELADRDQGRAEAHHRFTAGLYCFDAPDGARDAAGDGDAGDGGASAGGAAS